MPHVPMPSAAISSPRMTNMSIVAAGCLVAVLATVGALHAPRLFAATTVGLILSVAIYARPWTAIALVFALSGFALPLTLAGVDRTYLSTGTLVVALIGAACVLLRSLPTPPKAMLFPLAGLALVAAIGFVVGRETVPVQQSIQGIRIFAVPLLCAVIASTLRVADVRKLMRLGTVILAMSLIAAVIETVLGVDRLVGAGLEYGTSVRSYERSLRAPGLFTTNYSLGAFAGVMGALAWTWWPTLEAGGRAATWRLVALVCSVGCLVFSIYRTGILVLLVSIVVWLLTDRAANHTFARLAVVIGSLGFVAYLATSGLLSTKSLGQRVAIWEQLLVQYPPRFFGYGLGFSGSASGSRFSNNRVVVDNYALNLLTQLGVVGVLFLITLTVLAIRAVVRSVRDPRFASGGVLLAVLIGFLFVDYWEYTASMSLCLVAFVFAFQMPRAVAPGSPGAQTRVAGGARTALPRGSRV